MIVLQNNDKKNQTYCVTVEPAFDTVIETAHEKDLSGKAITNCNDKMKVEATVEEPRHQSVTSRFICSQFHRKTSH